MRLRLVSLCSVLAVSIVACGGSDSSKEPVKPQIGSVDLVATREGDATVLSASGPVSPTVVIPDDSLPSGVTSDDLTGSVLYATDPVTGATAVEFKMGPDGTQFTTPVDLSWVGMTGEGVTTAIMAVNDKGENLLSQDEAASIVSGMTTSDNVNGAAKVSLSVDHFSNWYVSQYDSSVIIDSVGKNFFEAGVSLGFDYWRTSNFSPQGLFTLDATYWGDSPSGPIKPCINPTINISGPATMVTRVGESCGKDSYDSRTIYLKCPDIVAKGTITVDYTAYFGVPSLAPMERFALLLSGTQQHAENYSENESAFIVSSNLTLFVKGRVTRDYNCADGVEPPATTDAPTTTASPTTIQPSTVVSTTVASTATPTTKVVGSTTTSTVRSNTTSSSTTTTVRATTTVPQSSTTWNPNSSVPTTPAPAEPAGTWLRNDSLCRWRGTSTCGIYSSGSASHDEVGPAGSAGSNYTPIGGSSGQLAYNLLAGNSIQNCDWNGSGGCGFYYTGTPGSYTLGPLG